MTTQNPGEPSGDKSTILVDTKIHFHKEVVDHVLNRFLTVEAKTSPTCPYADLPAESAPPTMRK